MSTWIRALFVSVLLTLIPALVGAAEPVNELPTLGGSDAQAEDINDLGQIVGWSERVGGAVEATIWNSEVPSGLGPAPATRFSFANAINNVGEVVGYSELGTVPGQPGNPRTATFWGVGVVVDIGASMAFTESTAFDINDNGVVALQGDHPGEFGFTAGYVWSLAMGGIQAGVDPFYRFGANHGINNLNDVVGYGAVSFDGGQAILARFNGAGWDSGVEIGVERRAVVWVDELIYDLNHLLRPTSSFQLLISASGVNAAGDVVGYGMLHNGDIRPFVIRELGRGPSSGLFGHPKTPANLR